MLGPVGVRLRHDTERASKETVGLDPLTEVERAYGPAHPKAGYAHIGLAYAELGATTSPGIERFRTARRILADALGPDSIGVAAADDGGAMALLLAGRADEAQAPAERALRITETSYGPDHPETARALRRVADVHRAQRRFADAKRSTERALAVFERVQGSQSPDARSQRLALAQVEIELGNPERGRALLEALIETAPGAAPTATEPRALAVLGGLQLPAEPSTAAATLSSALELGADRLPNAELEALRVDLARARDLAAGPLSQTGGPAVMETVSPR